MGKLSTSSGRSPRRVSTHRGRYATNTRLDLPVPVDIGVVEHDVALAANVTRGVGFTLEEQVDESPLQMARMGAVGGKSLEAYRPREPEHGRRADRGESPVRRRRIGPSVLHRRTDLDPSGKSV